MNGVPSEFDAKFVLEVVLTALGALTLWILNGMRASISALFRKFEDNEKWQKEHGERLAKVETRCAERSSQCSDE